MFKRGGLQSVKYTVVPQHVRSRVIRRERVLQAQGIDLAMGSLVHLIARAATLADSVDGEHWRQLLAGDHICFDGTGLKTLIVGQDMAWDGYLEVFTRDMLTVFQFDLTKHADRLRMRLDAFDGMVVCDAESRNAAMTTGSTRGKCSHSQLGQRRLQPALVTSVAAPQFAQNRWLRCHAKTLRAVATIAASSSDSRPATGHRSWNRPRGAPRRAAGSKLTANTGTPMASRPSSSRTHTPSGSSVGVSQAGRTPSSWASIRGLPRHTPNTRASAWAHRVSTAAASARTSSARSSGSRVNGMAARMVLEALWMSGHCSMWKIVSRATHRCASHTGSTDTNASMTSW